MALLFWSDTHYKICEISLQAASLTLHDKNGMEIPIPIPLLDINGKSITKDSSGRSDRATQP